jgi:thioredoxin-related protein
MPRSAPTAVVAQDIDRDGSPVEGQSAPLSAFRPGSWLILLAKSFAAACTGMVLSASALALDPVAIAKPSFLNLKQDAAEAAAAGKTLMVMFEQENCSYCIEMRRVNLTDPEATSIIRQHFDLVALDILGDREMTTISGTSMLEKQYARAVKVQFTPMTVFFAPDGAELFRMAGYYKPPVFKAALRYVAEKRYGHETFREYQRRTAADSSTERLQEEPFLVATNDLKDSLARAAKRGKGLALVFEQQHCPGCDELHGQTFKDRHVVDTLTGAFDVVRLDTWGTRQIRYIDGSIIKESRIAEDMDIRYTPTVVFLDQRGGEIFRFDSYRKPEHFAVVLRYLSTGAYLRYSSFQEWLRAEKPSARH